MLKKVNEAEVINSNGYRIKLHYRYLTYIEGDHAISVSSESVDDPFRLILSEYDLDSWYPPYAQETITSQKKQEIIKNITAALSFLRINHKWE